MSILADEKTRILVQGITGAQGSFHTRLMLEYGTRIVAGVTPGKGGRMEGRVPVFDTVKEALQFCRADFSIIFVPAPNVLSAAAEALENSLNIVIISEHVPARDAIMIFRMAHDRKRTMIGPNCPGIISPGKSKIGIMPGGVFRKGNCGILSRSGTLTYEIAAQLSQNGLGQSSVVGIGGDYINGYNFIDGLKAMQEDAQTKSIFLVGEIGGDAEERAAAYIKKNITKPVFACVAGRTAPPEKTMGHAGAIISGESGSYESKISALEKAGAVIFESPWQAAEVASGKHNKRR